MIDDGSAARPSQRVRFAYPVVEVSSRDNPTLKLARSLHRRRLRQRERATLVEGDRAVAAAIAAGAHVRACLLRTSTAHETLNSPTLAALSRDTRCFAVDDALFIEVATTESPQGVILIADIPDLPLPDKPRLVLVSDAVREPGNLGSMVRTATAAGADVVALLPGTVDAWHPEAVRGSAGTAFSIPIRHVASIDTVRDWFDASAESAIVLADADGDDLFDVDAWPGQVALIMGSEAHGARTEVRDSATRTVSLSMQRNVESLNVGAAAAVLLYVIRSRQH